MLNVNNYKAMFFKNTKIMLIIIYLLNLFDLVCTLILFQKYGFSIESNPFGRLLLSNFILLLIYKVIVVAAALCVIYLNKNKFLAVAGQNILFTVYSFIGLYHLLIISII
jgi:hypothetical protein